MIVNTIYIEQLTACYVKFYTKEMKASFERF